MGATLEKLIDAYVAPFVEEYKKEGSANATVFEDAGFALRETLRINVKTEIQKELTEEEIAKQKKNVDKAVAKHSFQKKLRERRSVIVEGLLVAFAVGLIVNQTTDLITYQKGPAALWPTVAIIIVLGLLVAAYLVVRLMLLVKDIDEVD